MMSNTISYLKSAERQFLYYKKLGEGAMEQLEAESLFWQPNEESNSIAIIVKHLHGNMLSRWTNFLTEDGEKPWRQRDEEFEVHNYSKQQVLDIWEKGWTCFLDALTSLTENDLLKTIYIREEPLLVIDAINRQLAHYPQQVGQIIYNGKLIQGSGWQSLSIEKGKSEAYNKSDGVKDPANINRQKQ